MGVIYRVHCEKCGVEFEHQAGVGFVYACVGCGDVSDDRAPFFCPACNQRYNPQDKDFIYKLKDVILWD
jgi:rubrerythrin